MRIVLAAGMLVAAMGVVRADIPSFEAVCPGSIAVRAEEGGPVEIGGRQADILSESKYAFDAREGPLTIYVMIKPDGFLSVRFTHDDGTEGVCLVGLTGPIRHYEQF